MNARMSNHSSRRSVLMWLAIPLVMVALLWLGMYGVGTASADGGADTGSQGNGLQQQYEQDPHIANCLFPGIPC